LNARGAGADTIDGLKVYRPVVTLRNDGQLEEHDEAARGTYRAIPKEMKWYGAAGIGYLVAQGIVSQRDSPVLVFHLHENKNAQGQAKSNEAAVYLRIGPWVDNASPLQRE
jgi:hypothetical protein